MLARRLAASLCVASLGLLVACGAPAMEEGDGATDGADRADVPSGHDGAALDGDAATTDAESMDGAARDGATPGDASAPDAGAPDAMVHCTAPSMDCGGACANVHTDAHNCGACGHACPSGAVCMDGACSLNSTCPPIHFPNVSIQSVPSASMTDAYRSITSGSCFPLPTCFIDLDHLEDPDTGRSLDVHVNVSPHFELNEFVATEIAGGYTHFALLDPDLVTHLESLRAAEGNHGITLASGYRSPQHQAATCRSICAGGASCCPSAAHPCGCRSEHEWGRAADLSIASTDYTAYGNYSHSVHFPDCLLEAGSFHVDVSPCPLGCPYHF